MVGIDVKQQLLDFVQQGSGLIRNALTPRELVVALLYELRGKAPLAAISRKVGRSRSSVGRWLNGKAEPRLPQFLELINAMTPRLMDFVAAFAEPSQLPSLRSLWAIYQAQRRIAYELPWSHAVLRALELNAYGAFPRHKPELIAKAVGLPMRESERQLTELAHSGFLTKTGTRWSKRPGMAIDTGGGSSAADTLKRHWAEVALERFTSGRLGDGLFSYNLFNISATDFRKVRALHLRYYNELRSIVQASQSNDRVVLVNQQLIPLDH